MIFETADEHCSDDCTEYCTHPDHQMECVVDLTGLLGFDRYDEVEPPARAPEQVLWL